MAAVAEGQLREWEARWSTAAWRVEATGSSQPAGQVEERVHRPFVLEGGAGRK